MTPPERTVWIVRHGHRADFEDDAWRDNAEQPHDPPLSAEGLAAAIALALDIETAGLEIHHVVSSPFLRALQTAVPVAVRLRLPLLIEAGMSEHLNAEWFEGPPVLHPRRTLEQIFPFIDRTHTSVVEPVFPESLEEHRQRMRICLERLLDRLPGNLILFGHGASVVGAVAALAKVPDGVDCSFCALNRVELRNGRWKLTTKPSAEGQPHRFH